MEHFGLLAVLLCWTVSGTSGAVTLTHTHPAAPYVCRTGNITLRCQYDAADGVFWRVGDMSNVNLSTIPGHSAFPRTTTYQEVVVDSYTNLRERYQCSVILGSLVSNSNNFMPPQLEAAEVTISSLTLASRTATTLNITWSAGYPKCYAFTVSLSTQDGSITVTQPADSDASHTLTSLQPCTTCGTTYRIEVEAVRKGDGVDGQRATFMGDFNTEVVPAAPVPSGTIIPTATSTSLTPRPGASTETTVACTHPQTMTTVTVTVLSVILSLVLTLSLSTCTVSAVVHAVMYKRLQRCRAELRGGGGDSVKAGPEGEGQQTREEEEVEGEKMQANPAYLPIEMMSYKPQESKYINVSS